MIRDPKTLARFAVEKGKVRKTTVNHRLFQPTRDLKLSVSCVAGLDNAGVKEEGIKVVQSRRNAHELHGWAEITEASVEETGLRVDYNNIPPRHAHILDWPEDSDKRMEIQQDLAANICRKVFLEVPIPVP